MIAATSLYLQNSLKPVSSTKLKERGNATPLSAISRGRYAVSKGCFTVTINPAKLIFALLTKEILQEDCHQNQFIDFSYIISQGSGGKRGESYYFSLQFRKPYS